MPEIRKNFIEELAGTKRESWRTLLYMSEFVSALDVLNELRPQCVSIFGSARSKPDSIEYEQALKIAQLLGQEGFGIITGGGPGVMEAANKGAHEAGAESVGLHIRLPNEQTCNPYVKTRADFKHFSNRKFMFVKYSMGYVVMPGGMGTIDELSEAFVLAQCKIIRRMPIILFDSSFWKGFIDWLRNVMVKRGFLSEDEVDRYITMADSPEEVVRIFKDFVS